MFKSTVEIIEVSNRTYVSAYSSNFYEGVSIGAIILNNFIIMVDSGMFPENSIKFRQLVEKKFHLPVKFTIITHYHGDHINGLINLSDTTIVTSENTKKNIVLYKLPSWNEKTKSEWQQLYPEYADSINYLEILIPEITFSEKMTIYDGDIAVEIIWLGGHTNGSSIVHIPSEKVIFTGDLVFQNRVPYASDPTCNPDLWIEALQKLTEYHDYTFISGHGIPVKIEFIEQMLEYFSDLKNSAILINQNKMVKSNIKQPSFISLQTDSHKNTYEGNINYWIKFYSEKES